MQSLVPPPPIDTAAWLREHFRTPDGRPFDEQAVPWVTAPGGPCWAVDCGQFRIVWLQWASRMFKSQFAQAFLLSRAHCDPSPMMVAYPDETLVKRVLRRVWRIIDAVPALRELAPRASLRSATDIKLATCEILGAWSRGQSRLADASIRFGHGGEIDKWDHPSTSDEGDPWPRFLKRGDEYTDRVFIGESTPSKKTKSRVERGRLRSMNCQFQVPCPHCQKYQGLRLGCDDAPGGIRWRKTPEGKSDPDLAFKTAWYECEHCQRSIGDEHKAAMEWLGVWVPEGCQVNHAQALVARELPASDRSWLAGDPLRAGQEWGGQISSLHALFQGWGQLAQKFLFAKKSKLTLRAFVNEELAETWADVEREQSWEAIARRWIVELPQGIAPTTASLVTIGIDKQIDCYKWVAVAWSPGMLGHVLDYGLYAGLDGEDRTQGMAQLLALLKRTWPSQGHQSPLRLAGALIDSGNRPKDVGPFVLACQRKGLPIWPCKGSSTRLEAVFRRFLQDEKSSMPGQMLTMVDSTITQDWIDDLVFSAATAGQMSIYQAATEHHEEFFVELMNEGPVEKINQHGHLVMSWDRLDANVPNDYRDSLRYASAAAWQVNLGTIPTYDQMLAIHQQQASQPRQRQGLRHPDGRSWIPQR